MKPFDSEVSGRGRPSTTRDQVMRILRASDGDYVPHWMFDVVEGDARSCLSRLVSAGVVEHRQFATTAHGYRLRAHAA